MSLIPRTRFAKDIVAEFLPPRRPSRKVIIFCSGMPNLPKKDALLRFFAAKGYWVFTPRYRGSWESEGEFLKVSPHQDVLDIIDRLPRGFKDLETGRNLRVKPQNLFVIGSSFGGPAALLVSRDPRVTKVVAISPVIDWRYPRTPELRKYMSYVHQSFGGAYRGLAKNYHRLSGGKFYNPITNLTKIAGEKIYLIHAQDDRVCSIVPVRRFARLTGCQLTVLQHGGHLGARYLLKPNFYRKVVRFLRTK